jgi:hypothetical protein
VRPYFAAGLRRLRLVPKNSSEKRNAIMVLT